MADENEEVQIVTPDFVKILDNALGAEGPVFDKLGEMFMVAPGVEKDGLPAGEILKIDLKNATSSLLVAPVLDGYGGVPAGMQCDKDNMLWVADMRLGILCVNPKDGTWKQFSKVDAEGNTMQGCNDCAFDYDGNLWVTAPAGNIAPHKYEISFEGPFGSVYCVTKDGKITKIDSGYLFSNGIAVQHTADGRPKKLIVAETGTKKLWGYDITGPGKVENKQLWGIVPGSHEGGPDGMDFDDAGNLLVANWGSSHLEVYGPEGGSPKQRIKCPFSRPSNLHFKPNSNEVYVTEHEFHGLWKFQWTNKGKAQYCDV